MSPKRALLDLPLRTWLERLCFWSFKPCMWTCFSSNRYCAGPWRFLPFAWRCWRPPTRPNSPCPNGWHACPDYSSLHVMHPHPGIAKKTDPLIPDMKEKRRKQVIFIASCGHSGSTILELLLTSNLHCVGIGEAFQLVDPRNRIIDHVEKYTCACGDPIETCELWGSIIEDLHQKRDLPVAEKYSIIFQNVSDHCKTDCIIDSSKVMGALESIARIPDVSVKVGHILRDVRAYWVSIKKRPYPKKRSPIAGSYQKVWNGGLL